MKDATAPELAGKRGLRRSRWWIGGLSVLTLTGLFVFCLPSILETGPARREILRRVDARLAPGNVEIERFDFSWTAPTRLLGLRLLDPAGAPVLEADRATLDQGLWSLITDPGHRPVLAMDSPDLDVRREADGTVNLAEAIAALFAGDPRTKPGALIILKNAALRFETPELAPIESLADVTLDLPPHGKPWSWEIGLRSDRAAADPDLVIHGSRERPIPGAAGPPALNLAVEASDWPTAVRIGGDVLTFRVRGASNLHFDRKLGGWSAGAGLDLRDLAASPDLRLPDLRVDLSYAPTDGQGAAEVAHVLKLTAEADSLGNLADLEGSVSLDVDAMHDPRAGRLLVREARLVGGEQVVEVRGQVSDLNTDAPLVEMSGVAPLMGDLLDGLLSRAMGLDLRIEGERLDVSVSGRLDDAALTDPIGRLDLIGRLSVESADAVGLHLGPASLSARTEAGALAFAPIDTTLNGGRVRMTPEVLRGPDGVLLLRIAEGSAIEGAEINEELSSDVLAFAVPVLERATHPTGRVSAVVRRAEIPIGPGSAGRSPDVEATIVFDNVEFGPGPLADSILKLLNREGATLRLDQPVVAVVADRRVQTRGLAIPIAGVTAFELEGSVGFDRSLDLTARLPITRRMLGNVPIVSEIFGGLAVEVPIGGELGQPKLDKVAFNEQLRSLAAELAERGVSGGLNGVFNLLDRIREKRMQRREAMRPGDFGPP